MTKQLLSLSKDHNPNYVASIQKVTNIREHPNAERLNLCTVQGQTVIIGKDVKEGDIGVYFPLECIINHNFLSFCNLYRDKELNFNKEEAGFFEAKYKANKEIWGGRVRAVRLRGVLSEGFWIEIKKFAEYINNSYSEQYPVGTEFDMVNEEWFVKKYIPQQTQGSGNKHKEGKKAKVSLIVPDQFRFHLDTEQLQRNMFVLNSDDLISITYKLHGTSAISTKLLVRDISLKGKIGRWLGYGGTKYDSIYSSRKVIKNQWLGVSKGTGYYDEDIWRSADLTLQPYLEKGVSMYYEIVGWVGNKPIQKDYDYSCLPGEFNTYIYRITYTNQDGKTFEFSAKQVQLFCKDRGINPVPELYYGYVHDLFSDAKVDYSNDAWRDTFLELLKEVYVENRNCTMCKNKVPAEGIVLRIDNSLSARSFKLKNTSFLLRESKELDAGVLNIEDNS